MTRLTTRTWFGAILGAICVCVGSMHATDIGGTISTTLTITTDSQLVDDVTCTVTGAPCISIVAPTGDHVTLELNGFTMTGQADPQTACNGGPSTFDPLHLEDGIDTQGQVDVTIHGPGLIRQFRGPGIFANQSIGLKVTGVTVSTNCMSGILVGGGSDHQLVNNVSVRNGNGNFSCGGI